MSTVLIDRIRDLVTEGGISRSGLARAAGLHANSLRSLDDAQWNPTADTLRKLESYLIRREAAPALVPIEEIIDEARNGRMFILVDDEDRENEGDLIIPAQMATPDAINFMAKHGRGLVCLALAKARVDQLGLNLMSRNNGTRHETAFTVSIEARDGVTTGISAGDRARTVSVAIDASKGPEHIVTPGHIFPLIAREGGVLVRAGHTEAAVDVSRLAGLNPSGVICEIMKDDGTMARMDDLIVFAQEHNLKIGTIRDLIAYRRSHDHLVEKRAEARLIAVFLVNDPDFEATASEPVKGSFGGQAMTYYGRWTYKFEEAARRGAIGALIVHDTPGAGYGWSTVIAGGGENYDIVRPASEPQRVMIQGWIEGQTATGLFKAAGQDLAALRIKARRADFKPVALKGLRLDADFPVTMERIESRNVLGKLTGTKHPDETIMFGAHWDAYGVGAPDAQGRTVRAGANDDALGLAGVIELARNFAVAPRTERTLVFAAWTAEESGLLGSETYGVKPLYPLDKTVANLTLDILQTAGLARDVVLVGKGQGDLEQDLAKAAALQGRIVTAETLPERGLFYRADHFSLARRGVPVLLLMGIGGGADLVEGGRAAGDKWVSDYTANCYHKPCDAYDASWNLSGAAQDVALFHTIGVDLANGRRWPDWNSESEFRAIRAKSAEIRQ